MTLDEEIALVAGVLADEAGAAERLWDYLGATVCRVAASGSRWNHNGEDQSSSIWLHLHRNNWRVLAAWGKSVPLLAYIHAIAVNQVIDQHRSAVVRMGARDANGPETDVAAPASQGPEAQLETERTLQAVRRAFQTLDPRAKQVFRMKFMDGYSQAEIAKALDIPLTNVGQVIARARLSLLAALPQAYRTQIDRTLPALDNPHAGREELQ